MEAFLVAVFIVAGQIGIGYAVPMKDLAACEQAKVLQVFETNYPGFVETSFTCMTKKDFDEMLSKVDKEV